MYQLINFGQEVQNMAMSMPTFIIKSEGCSNSALTVSLGTVGSQAFIFNQWYALIKEAFILDGGGTYVVNHTFGSIDISNKGTYQISIGGTIYPQLQLNAGQNRNTVIQELRKAIGALYDTKNSMSINTVEFAY